MTARWTPAQWAAFAGSVAILVWAVPGLIVNPDFAIGDAATSERVLGVDMNGWHALSGFLVAIPGFVAMRRADLAFLFDVAAAGSLLATAGWAALETQVAGGLFYFPHQEADVLLHLFTTSIFAAGAAHHLLRARRATV